MATSSSQPNVKRQKPVVPEAVEDNSKTFKNRDETIRSSRKHRLSLRNHASSRNRKPRPPRPRRQTKLTLPENLITNRPTTPKPADSLKLNEGRSRSSTPGLSFASHGPETPLIRLSRLTILLTAIHKRNKNQHCNQPFYKHFSILRRSVNKLLHLHEQSASLAGDVAIPAAPNQGSTTPSATDIRRRFETEAQLRSQREVLEEYIRETIVPAAYVTFSGVVADTQFANLGLVLLGLLADVVGVVGNMRRVDEVKLLAKSRKDVVGGRLVGLSTLVTGPDHGAIVERVFDSDGGIEVNESSVRATLDNDQKDDDVGEIVARDELTSENTARRIATEGRVRTGSGKNMINETADHRTKNQINEKTGTSQAKNTSRASSSKDHAQDVLNEKSKLSPGIHDTYNLDEGSMPHRVEGKEDKSKIIATQENEDTATSQVYTQNEGRARPLKDSDTESNRIAAAVSVTDLKSEEKDIQRSREKMKKKSKKKDKKTNAIDDLFSGFG